MQSASARRKTNLHFRKRLRPLRQDLSAIHHDRLTGHIARPIRGEIRHCLTDVLRLAQHPQRHGLRHLGEVIIAKRLQTWVIILPGITALMVILSPASSIAAERMNPICAALVAP